MFIFLDIVTVLSFSVSIIFILVYGFVSPWWKSLFGRALMFHVFSLSYLMFPLLLHHPFNILLTDKSWLTSVQTSAQALVSLTAAYLLYVLLKAQGFFKR